MKPFGLRDTKPPGECTTVMRADNVLLTTFRGHVTPEVIITCTAQIKLNLKYAPPAPYWLADAVGVTYSASIVKPASEMVSLVRNAGRSVVGVVQSGSAVLMIARTICLAAGIPLTIFETLAEAEQFIISNPRK